MHIPLGHREIGVPGQFLNGTDGGTPHRQMGTKRVAQDVYAEVRQACATCHTSDPVWCEKAAEARSVLVESPK